MVPRLLSSRNVVGLCFFFEYLRGDERARGAQHHSSHPSETISFELLRAKTSSTHPSPALCPESNSCRVRAVLLIPGTQPPPSNPAPAPNPAEGTSGTPGRLRCVDLAGSERNYARATPPPSQVAPGSRTCCKQQHKGQNPWPRAKGWLMKQAVMVCLFSWLERIITDQAPTIIAPPESRPPPLVTARRPAV